MPWQGGGSFLPPEVRKEEKASPEQWGTMEAVLALLWHTLQRLVCATKMVETILEEEKVHPAMPQDSLPTQTYHCGLLALMSSFALVESY